MQIPMNYDELRKRYPEKVAEALQSLRTSKVRERDIEVDKLSFAIYASAVCDDSYGYQYGDDINKITIPVAFTASIRLTLPRSPKSHKPPREFYSESFTKENFPQEILDLYLTRYAQDREHSAKVAKEQGREAPEPPLALKDSKILRCLCGKAIIGKKVSDRDFAIQHKLGVYPDTSDGLTFLYICSFCDYRAKTALNLLKEVFGSRAEHLHFHNHLQ